MLILDYLEKRNKRIFPLLVNLLWGLDLLLLESLSLTDLIFTRVIPFFVALSPHLFVLAMMSPFYVLEITRGWFLREFKA